jgi:aldehyde dehydrogenase (NAD+)
LRRLDHGPGPRIDPEVEPSGSVVIGGEWVEPSSRSTITVTESATEEPFFSVAEAQAADIDRAVTAAHEAFASGPWPRMSHAERADYLRAIASVLRRRADEVSDIWPRESGVVHSIAQHAAEGGAKTFEFYASLADTFPFEEQRRPTAGGDFGLLVREPVGVVGAIIPWNGPMSLISRKVSTALLRAAPRC